MKRYYLSRVVTEPDPDRPQSTVRKAKIETIPHEPGEARVYAMHPTKPWCLALVDRINHLALQSDPDIRPMPDTAQAIMLSALSNAERRKITDALEQFGIPYSTSSTPTGGLQFDTSNSFKHLLRQLGQLLDPAFHEANFDANRG